MTNAIEKLIQPRSIAIIGASADFHKLNGRVMKFLIDHGFKGGIYPVNPKYDMIGELTDREIRVEHGPVRAGDVPHSQADDSRVRELFSTITPVPLEIGLKATVDWMREVL